MNTMSATTGDLLGGFEQTEIALEYALRDHGDALREMLRVPLEDMPRVGERLQTTMLRVLALRDRRACIRAEIAQH
jgi:hypothetical protein